MMKLLPKVKFILIAAFAAYLSPSGAQIYEPDEENPLITQVSATGETQLTSNCTWTTITSDNDNYEFNKKYIEDGYNLLGALIDNDQTTYWHSNPSADLHSTTEWIMIDMKRTDISRFYLFIDRRADVYKGELRHGSAPTKLLIEGADDLDGEWTTVTTVTSVHAAYDDTGWPFEELITAPKAFRYYRLTCRDAQMNTGASISFWSISELQCYPAKEVTDQRVLLTALTDSLANLDRTYVGGTEVGCVSQEALDYYSTALDEATTLEVNASATQEQLGAAVVKLRTAVDSLVKSLRMPENGKRYFIVSGYPEFSNQQSVTKAMYADGRFLKWTTLDKNDPRQYFVVTVNDDSTYSYRNVFNGKYVGYTDGDGVQISYAITVLVDDQSIKQKLTPLYDGNFYLSNDRNDLPNHPRGHNDGAGASGDVVQASVYSTQSEWTFMSAEDIDLDSLIDLYNRKEAAAALSDSLTAVKKTISTIKAPDKALITDPANQVTSNCQWTQDQGDQYNPTKMFDGDYVTHFHSDPSGMSIATTDEWLQFDLQSDNISNIMIHYWGRDDANWHDTPSSLVIKATNKPDDENSWVTVAELSDGFPANVAKAEYMSPTINMNQNYRYIRMIVKRTTSGNPYWNISEMMVYGSKESLYTKSPEMKEAIDNLEKAVATAEDHISNLTVDGTEMATINEAMAAVNKLLEVSNEVLAEASNAESLYNKLFVQATDGYIKTVNTKNDGTNQLTANCTWTSITPDNDNYSFNQAFIEDGYNLLGALIDNDDQTYWHSDPNADLRSSESYIQIDLQRSDVSSFILRIDRRNDLYQGANRHGILPTEMVLYGTNDETLGADVTASCGQWTQLATLSDIPDSEDNTYSWPYTHTITLDAPYRYLRLRATRSAQYGFWCMSGLQLLGTGEDSYDKVKSQYYSVEGMKDAADELMSTIESARKAAKDGLATKDDIASLKDAEQAVLELWQNRDGLDSLVERARLITAGTVEIGNNIGQLPDESLLNNLKNAIETATSTTATSTEIFNTIFSNLKNAYEAVQTGVVSVEPGKWYYILSATSDEDACDASADAYYNIGRDQVKGAALYVLSDGGEGNKGTEEGNYWPENQLRWGMDNIKYNTDGNGGWPTEGDVDAIWRFVPVEGESHTYYIQNLRTGWYVGKINESSEDYFYMSSATPRKFRIDFIGNGQFNITPTDGFRKEIPLSFRNKAHQVCADNVPYSQYNRAAMTFEEFSMTDYPQIFMRFANNSARIVTLPFEVADITANQTSGLSITAYTVTSAVDASHLGLTEKHSFKAGEPFILVIGDTTKYAEDHSLTDICFDTPTTLSTEPAGTDAFVPSFTGDTVNSDKMVGTFSSSLFRLYPAGTDVTVLPATGYILPELLPVATTTPDAVLEISGDTKLVSIRPVISADATGGTVDVYTTDGVLLKKGVKAAEAEQGLGKGIYIIGKKKVEIR